MKLETFNVNGNFWKEKRESRNQEKDTCASTKESAGRILVNEDERTSCENILMSCTM